MRLKLGGMVYFGDPVHSVEGWTEGNEIGKLWRRFEELCEAYADIIEEHAVELGVAYEIHIAYPETEVKEYHIFVGIETKGPVDYPLELFYKELPETQYAVFTMKGLEMAKEIAAIYTDWLPKSEYVESYPMLIQRYDMTRFKGLDDPDSEIDVMLPVRKADEVDK